MGFFSNTPRFDGVRLKTSLRVCSQRLQVLQKKKASLNVQLRKEIANLLTMGKEDSAYIKVELLILEDNTIEAMELLDLYCNTLLARMGLITQYMYCDPSILEAVASIMWAAPRMPPETRELCIIRDCLAAKFGPEFTASVMENRECAVSEKVLKRLDIRPPPKKLVNAYLEEIAKAHQVTWIAKPDTPPTVAFDLLDLSNETDNEIHHDFVEPIADLTAPPPYLFESLDDQTDIPVPPPVLSPTVVPLSPEKTKSQVPSDDDFADLIARFNKLKNS